MSYAEVSVNSPIAQRRAFSYAIPPRLEIDVGQAVWVPFGDKRLQGIVLEIGPHPEVEETREIIGVIEPHPLLSPQQVELARWISQYYLSPLFDAVALMLPPGFERRTITFISPTDSDIDLAALTEEQKQTLVLVRAQGSLSLAHIEKALGKKKAASVVAQLVNRGLVARSYELEKIRVKPKVVPYIGLAVDNKEAEANASALRKQAPKQASLLEYLLRQNEAVPWPEARRESKATRAAADALVSKGLIKFEAVEVRREPIAYDNITPSPPLTLTRAQKSAFEAIKSGLAEDKSQVFLLHGVTGSGKTEVYLQALAEAVKLGKKGIVLVPEIALTPQTIERFAARFPHRVAVLHSKLSLGEQFDEWQRISMAISTWSSARAAPSSPPSRT